jgi:hypothetical protein
VITLIFHVNVEYFVEKHLMSCVSHAPICTVSDTVGPRSGLLVKQGKDVLNTFVYCLYPV